METFGDCWEVLRQTHSLCCLHCCQKGKENLCFSRFLVGYSFFSWDAKLLKMLSPWPVPALCKAMSKDVLYGSCFFANAADFRFTLPQLLPLFPQPKSVEATERPEHCFSNWWWLPLHYHYRLERKKVLALKVTQTADLVEPQRQCWIFPSYCDRDCKVKWDTGIRSSAGLDTPLSCLPCVKGSQNIPSLALIINCKLNSYETCFKVVCLE